MQQVQHGTVDVETQNFPRRALLLIAVLFFVYGSDHLHDFTTIAWKGKASYMLSDAN